MTATFIDLNGAQAEIKLSVILIVLLSSLIIPIVFYLLRSFGVYKLAKNNGAKKAFMAFIPFVWVYPASQVVGNVRIFSKKINRFPIVMLWTFLTFGVLSTAISVLNYIPLIGYCFQGGNVLLSSSAEFFPLGTYYYDFSGLLVCAPNLLMPYSEVFIGALNVISTVLGIAELVILVLEISLYLNIFKCFLPRHYLIATIFSILGLFGPFVFAVRKNEKFDYDEYIRKIYANRYNNPYGNPYNDPYNNPYNNPYGGNANYQNGKQDSPFDEFNDKGDSPFDEFNNDGDNK